MLIKMKAFLIMYNSKSNTQYRYIPDPQTTNKNNASSHGLTGVLFFSDF